MSHLPPELARKWGHLRYIRQTGRNQWNAECPQCGSNDHDSRSGQPDRFAMWADGRPRGWCRRCFFFSFVDERTSYSAEERLAWEVERRRLAESEARRLQDKLSWYRSSSTWTIYHDGMSEEQRQHWRQAGIPDGIQDWLRLGYVPGRTFYSGTSPVVSDALTIPYFGPEWSPSTMQYRLLSPPNPNDKYRFQAGLPAPLYLCDPDSTPKGPCLLAEGAKKGILGWMYLADKLAGGSVVASPSKTPRPETLEILENCDPIYVLFDPDATPEELRRVSLALKPERVRLVVLPVKLDDAFTGYCRDGRERWAMAAHIWNFFQIARPAIAA